jgi:hypothetical protein
MEVISTNATLGAMSPKEQVISVDPATKKTISFVDSREDGVPELYASDSGSMDSFEKGRVSTEEEEDARSAPAYTRAKSAENISFSKSVTNNDLKFAKQLDEEGQKELALFLQAPSSVILQSILEYQPTESFGFVKTHVHDGLSDDENEEYDADDMTAAVFPSRTARTAAAAGVVTAVAATGTTAAVARSTSRRGSSEEMDAKRLFVLLFPNIARCSISASLLTLP